MPEAGYTHTLYIKAGYASNGHTSSQFKEGGYVQNYAQTIFQVNFPCEPLLCKISPKLDLLTLLPFAELRLLLIARQYLFSAYTHRLRDRLY